MSSSPAPLAIIPITLALALWRTARASRSGGGGESGFSLKKVFPTFILFFVLASVITTVATAAGVDSGVFTPFKELSKFLIIMAMGAIGLNTDLVNVVKSGGKPILMGFCCWVAIAAVSLGMQHVLASGKQGCDAGGTGGGRGPSPVPSNNEQKNC